MTENGRCDGSGRHDSMHAPQDRTRKVQPRESFVPELLDICIRYAILKIAKQNLLGELTLRVQPGHRTADPYHLIRIIPA